MDRTFYDEYVARYVSPGVSPPRLMTTWFDSGGADHMQIEDGSLYGYTEHPMRGRCGGLSDVEPATLAALDGLVAALPPGSTHCRPERSLLLGFVLEGVWTHRIYDRDQLPDSVRAIFDALEVPAPAAEVPRVRRLRRLRHDHRDLQAMALSPGGLLAIGARDGGSVRDLASGRTRARFDGGYPIEAVAFVGEEVAWCTWRELRVGARILSPEAQAGTVVGGTPPVIIVQRHASSSIAVSPDGRLLAISYFDASAQVTVLELPGLVRRSWLAGHEKPVVALAFSPDSQTLATGDWSSEVRLWSVASGEAPGVLLERCVLQGSVAALAFSPDGGHLAAASRDGLRFWDIATGARVDRRACTGVPGGEGCAIAWGPGGLLAEARASGVVIWETAGWRELCFLETTSRPVSLAFASPTSLVVCCAKEVEFYDLTRSTGS